MSKSIRIFVAFLFLALAAHSAQAAETTTLKHDDGSQESKRSITGAGHAVRFECPDGGAWYVEGISIHGSRYGDASGGFKVVVASDDLTRRREIDRPYKLFERGDEKWVRVDIDPVEVEGAFHVAAFFSPTQTKGVYVGIDEADVPTHSSVLLASDPGKEGSELEGHWMIRVHLAKEIEEEGLPLLDEAARRDAEAAAKAAREKALLGDARSVTLASGEGEMEGERNIQGALYTMQFDTRELETPESADAYVWEVEIYASQFGGRHNSEEVSGDVYILDENRRVITRTTFPYSLATHEKQWIAIPTLPTKVKGKFYVAIDAHGSQFKGLYMGFREGNAKGLASTDELKGDEVRPADWSKKFEKLQWMIRAKVADRPVAY